MYSTAAVGDCTSDLKYAGSTCALVLVRKTEFTEQDCVDDEALCECVSKTPLAESSKVREYRCCKTSLLRFDSLNCAIVVVHFFR